MAQDNIIDKLKAKEEEMDALINETRKKAASIKEEALRRAKEVRESKAAELEREIQSTITSGEEDIKSELNDIEVKARMEAAALRQKGAEKLSAAIEYVMRIAAGGFDDKGSS